MKLKEFIDFITKLGQQKNRSRDHNVGAVIDLVDVNKCVLEEGLPIVTFEITIDRNRELVVDIITSRDNVKSPKATLTISDEAFKDPDYTKRVMSNFNNKLNFAYGMLTSPCVGFTENYIDKLIPIIYDIALGASMTYYPNTPYASAHDAQEILSAYPVNVHYSKKPGFRVITCIYNDLDDIVPKIQLFIDSDNNIKYKEFDKCMYLIAKMMSPDIDTNESKLAMIGIKSNTSDPIGIPIGSITVDACGPGNGNEIVVTLDRFSYNSRKGDDTRSFIIKQDGVPTNKYDSMLSDSIKDFTNITKDSFIALNKLVFYMILTANDSSITPRLKVIVGYGGKLYKCSNMKPDLKKGIVIFTLPRIELPEAKAQRSKLFKEHAKEIANGDVVAAEFKESADNKEDSDNNTISDDLSMIQKMIVSLDQLFTTHSQLGDPVMYKTYAELIVIYCETILDELRKGKNSFSALAKLIRIIKSMIDYVRLYDEFNATNINAIKVFIALALNEAKLKDY